MWCRSYRNHVIMAFPSFDTATGLWAPQANITWVAGPLRESEFVRFSKRVMSEDDAVACASRAAQTWIDKRLRSLQKASPRRSDITAGSPVGASLQPLSGGAAKFTRRVKSLSSSTRMLTFDRFKSMMLKSGISVSDQRLQKSYAALVALRRRNHCSWAHITAKMEHTQAMMTGAQTEGLNLKLERLPLTLGQWRRII